MTPNPAASYRTKGTRKSMKGIPRGPSKAAVQLEEAITKIEALEAELAELKQDVEDDYTPNSQVPEEMSQEQQDKLYLVEELISHDKRRLLGVPNAQDEFNKTLEKILEYNE